MRPRERRRSVAAHRVRREGWRVGSWFRGWALKSRHGAGESPALCLEAAPPPLVYPSPFQVSAASRARARDDRVVFRRCRPDWLQLRSTSAAAAGEGAGSVRAPSLGSLKILRGKRVHRARCSETCKDVDVNESVCAAHQSYLSVHLIIWTAGYLEILVQTELRDHLTEARSTGLLLL